MDWTKRASTAGAALEHLTAHARLPLPEGRPEKVAPMIDTIATLIDDLDALDMPETPPATAFDARWQ